jgi:peptidoglycan/xylan/chitin deacetylase (PgdA/CDA1 family)
VRWWSLPPGLYCFNYHRIGNPATSAFDRNTFSCTAERFEEQVVFLKEKFEVLSLARLLDLAQRRHPWRKPCALITFDDGYVDNYSAAFPILKKHGASAVFFLPTAFIGTSRIPWWDEIAWLLRQTPGKSIRLAGADEPFLLRAEDAERGIWRVIKFVKSRKMPMERQVEEIRAACGGVRPPQQAAGDRLFMNWAEAREMHSGGMDIGSHTHTHRLLAHLDSSEQREELTGSKEILEAEIGAEVTSVAYPVGSRSAYTDETCELAEEAGYRLGFTFLRHNNPLPLSHPYAIGRLAVDGNIGRVGMRSMICFPSLFAG